MKINNFNCPEQSAYKKHHSTELLIIKMTDDLLIASNGNSATAVMLLNLSAAFVTVTMTYCSKSLNMK